MAVKTEMFDLTGRVALVTGGASGIGKAIAAAFVEHGGNVLVGSRTMEKVEAATRELDALRDNSGDEPVAAGVTLDVTSDNSVKHAVRKAMDVFGRLDIVVNSAGVQLKKPTFDVTPDELNQVHEVHVTGTWRVCQEAGHIFREQHSGCIINLASMTSYVDLIEVAAYAAAKSAILGVTRSLANEWAKHGIRTNAIAPGFVPTDLNRKLIEGTDRGRRILEHTPVGRFGTAEEIASTAVYLAAPGSSFVNGAVIPVDGGYLTCGIGDSTAPWAE